MYTSVGWLVLGPSYFAQYVVFSGSFYRYCLQLLIVSCGLRAKNGKETATHMHGHARTARRPGRPDERPDERASYKCSLRPRQAA